MGFFRDSLGLILLMAAAETIGDDWYYWNAITQPPLVDAVLVDGRLGYSVNVQ